MTLSTNPQRFIESCGFTLALAAHVSCINASVLTRDSRQFDQLFGLGVVSRWIDQRGRNTECALPHCLRDQSLHFVELFRGRLSINFAKNRLPHLRGADVGADV